MTALNRARFTIDGSPSEDPTTGDRGFDVTPGQTLDITLELNPARVLSVKFLLPDPNNTDENAPVSSINETQQVFVENGDTTIELSEPNDVVHIVVNAATEISSYVIRCEVVDDTGLHVFERIISVREVGLRMTVPAERQQYNSAGWSVAMNEMALAIALLVAGGGGLVVSGSPNTGDVPTWNGSAAAWTPPSLPNIATDRLYGRDTAGTGQYEAISLDATLEFTGSQSIRRAALTGDVTAAAGSNTTAIANSAVTLAKMANIATDSLIGRDTAGSGAPEVIGLQASLEFTGSGTIRRAALTGDVTAAAGSNVLSIAAGSIALSKLVNIATDSLIGRDTAGSGAPEVIAVSGGLEFTGAQVLQRSALTGDVTAAAGSNTTAIAAGVIVDADVNANAAIALSKLATQAALSVVANATNATAVPTAVAAGSDHQVFRRSGTALAFGAVNLAQSAAVTGLLPFANIADGSALSVFGRSTNSAGVMASIVGADGQALRVSGTTLGFGTLATAAYADNSVTLAKLATQAALSVLANATNATAVPSAVVAASDFQVFRRTGTALAFGSIDLSQAGAVGSSLLAHANIAHLAALSVFGRSSATPGVMAAITGTDGQILRVSGTTLAFGSITTGGISDDSVTFAKLQNIATDTLIGRDTAGTGDPEAISLNATLEFTGTGSIQRAALTGDVTASAGSNVTAIAAGVIVDADINAGAAIALSKLASQAALSVVMNATNASAVPTAVVAGSDHQVLRRSGTVLAFGAVNLAQSAAVTGLLPFANIADGVARSVFGRASNTAGVQASIGGGGAGTVLVDNGTTLLFTTIGTTGIADNSVTYGKMQDIPTDTLIGRDTTGSGDPESISLNSTLEFTGSNSIQRAALTGDITAAAGSNTTAIAAGVIVDADVNAAAAIAGTKISPNFGSQTVTTTGNLVLGASPATTGRIRLTNNDAIYGRSTVLSDAKLVHFTSGDAAVFGDSPFPSILNGSSLSLRISNVEVAQFSAPRMTLLVPQLRFDASQVSPSISQADETSNGVNGDGLTIQAQNSTGTTTTGGTLHLQSGTGTTAAGPVRFYNGATNNMTMHPTGLDVAINIGFVSTMVSPQLSQNADSTAAATGDQFQINAQDMTGTGATVGGVLHMRAGNSTNGTGGGIDIRSGTGPTAAGIFNLRVGSSVFFSYPGTAIPASTGLLRLPNAQGITARNNANSTDISVLTTNSSDGVFLGDATNAVSVSIQTSGARLILGTNIEIQNSSQLRFDSTVASPSIVHEDDATGSITADTFQISAQNATGATSTGGPLDLRSGTGTTAAGTFRMRIGATIFFSYPGNVVPSSDGSSVLRLPHNIVALSARDSSNTTNRSLIRWGTTSDELIVGNTDYATRILSDSLVLGNVLDTWAEVEGASNRINLGFGGAQHISFGASLMEIGATPATSGNFRLSHNQSMQGRDNANSANRNILRWGATTDTTTLGDSAVDTTIVGLSARMGSNGTIETTGIDGNIVAINHNGKLSTTQIPSGVTGSGYIYLADAASLPGWGSSSGVVNGMQLWHGAGYGFQAKTTNRCETTIVADGGTDSRIRKWIGTKKSQSATLSGAGSNQVIVALDCSNINGAGNLNQRAGFFVEFRFVAMEGGDVAAYTYSGKWLACCEWTAAGVLAIKGTVVSDPGIFGTGLSVPTVTIAVSGSEIRGVITLAASGITPLHCFGVLEIMGLTYL